MIFRVHYKGIQKFAGSLALAYAYLTEHWGSASRAAELGIKLEPML